MADKPKTRRNELDIMIGAVILGLIFYFTHYWH